MDTKKTYTIAGMSCAACAARIEKGLNKVSGVKQANVNFAVEKATVEFDAELVSEEILEETVKNLGYEVIHEKAPTESRVTLKLSGMSCAACAARIEKGLNKIDGWQKQR